MRARVLAAAALVAAAGCGGGNKNPLDRALGGAPKEFEARSLPAEVVLLCSEPDAEVMVDGVPQGRCDEFAGNPRGLALDERPHQLQVVKKGFLPYQVALQSGGARTTLKVELTPQR